MKTAHLLLLQMKVRAPAGVCRWVQQHCHAQRCRLFGMRCCELGMLPACLRGAGRAAAAIQQGRLNLHNLSPSLTTCWTCKRSLFPWKLVLSACAAVNQESLPSSNPRGEENKLQRCCPRAGSLIAAAFVIHIPLKKRKRKKKSLLPAPHISPDSLRALSVSEGRGNCFNHSLEPPSLLRTRLRCFVCARLDSHIAEQPGATSSLQNSGCECCSPVPGQAVGRLGTCCCALFLCFCIRFPIILTSGQALRQKARGAGSTACMGVLLHFPGISVPACRLFSKPRHPWEIWADPGTCAAAAFPPAEPSHLQVFPKWVGQGCGSHLAEQGMVRKPRSRLIAGVHSPPASPGG